MFKVVCIDDSKFGKLFSTPVLNEIVTVVGFMEGSYLLREYGCNFYHKFTPEFFRPLDETFATETLAEIAEQIESEKLITST